MTNGIANPTHADKSVPSSAAFFRIEGTLTERSTLAAAGYFAAGAQGLGERLARLGNVALAAPFSFAGELTAGASKTRMTWMGVRGMSEDRLIMLADEYYEHYLSDSLLKVGVDLVKQAKTEGRRVVFISDNIDLVMAPLATQLGADDLICNRLELRKHKATGRLEDPVIGGNVAGQWAREFAKEQGVDLTTSWAYGARGSDGLLLSAIGRPCVVNPDWQLRRMAADHSWPVVEK